MMLPLPLCLRRALVAVAALLSLAVAAPAAAQSAAPSRAEIEQIVRDYILANPQIIQEALEALDKRAAAEDAARRREALTTNRDLLVNSPRGVVLGNPKGDVTLVEFFDYNCGYCKRALGDLLELIKTDAKLRVVLKDFPVLSESSVEAAKVAVAAKLQASGQKYLDFHQKLMAGRGEATRERALAVAREVGLDIARLTRDLDNPEVVATLQENHRLAQALGINGTPSYVIGDQVVAGAVGLQNLQQQIKTTRDGCKSTSC